MDDNVLKFPADKSQPRAADVAPTPVTAIDGFDMQLESKEAMLMVLDDVRRLVESGQMTSLSILGLSPEGATFMEHCWPQERPWTLAATYLGVVTAFASELTDMVRSMPQLINDGSIVMHMDVDDA